MRLAALLAAVSMHHAAAEPIAYFSEPQLARGQALQPEWTLISPASGVQIKCYFANLFRAAPWPKSGGFCYFHNIKADAASAALLLPDDFVLAPRTPHPMDDNAARKVVVGEGAHKWGTEDHAEQKWGQVIGRGLSSVLGNTFYDASGMRGGLAFKNVSATDPRLCPSHARSDKTVLMTPMGDPTSMKHWAVSAMAAFSLNLHLKHDFGLPHLTHMLAGHSNRTGQNAWVDFMRSALPRAAGVEVLPGNTLNEKITSSKRKEALLPKRVPGWAQQCFDGVIVGVGAGHSIDPLWLLDRSDTLRLRRTLARAILAYASPAAAPVANAKAPPSTPPRKSLTPPQTASLRVLAETSIAKAKRLVQQTDATQLNVLIVNRKKRRLGNAPEIVEALKADVAAKEGRTCSGLAGECDLSWRLSSINHTRMEGASAAEQVRTWLDGPNVVIVPHGAGSTHATYLPPCSVVLEVVPNMYPQFSFLVPTMRAGVHMLYLYEASTVGNPMLSCLNTSKPTSGRSFARLARNNPVMTVDTSLLVQMVHRGSFLRKRCLANFPNIEFNPHERLLQTGLAKAGAKRHWATIPRMVAPQEAIGAHFDVPIIATGPGVTKALADAPRSLAARDAAWPCRTWMPHSEITGPPCIPPSLEPRKLLHTYATLRGPKLPSACADTCGSAANPGTTAGIVPPTNEEACRVCLHASVTSEVIAQHTTPSDPSYRKEIATRTTCRGSREQEKGSKHPPQVKDGIALYRAALVAAAR